MTAQKLILWSHLVLALSGLYEIVAGSQGLIGWALFIIGLAGLHARQAKKAGWFGYVGLGILIISSVLSLIPVIAGNNLFSNNLFLSPTGKGIAYLLFETSIVAQSGYFLYGLVSLRAGIFPQAVNLLLIITVVLMIIAGNFGQGICMVAIGIILWKSKFLGELTKR
jgi:hypothetical protein